MNSGAGTGLLVPPSDPTNRRVAAIVLNAAAHAYAYPRVHDEGWDPQLCHRCQWIRPTDNSTLCTDCQGGTDA